MKLTLILVAGLILLPLTASAEYDSAPWRTIVSDTTSQGVITYRISVSESAIHDGRPIGWNRTQDYARSAAINCGPLSWDEFVAGEKAKYIWAMAKRDQQYKPLQAISFLIVSIEAERAFPLASLPTWRDRPRDKVYLKLRDGRELFSLEAVDLPEPRVTVYQPGSVREDRCWQLVAMLRWRPLYTAAELAAKAKSVDRRYVGADKSPGNEFLIPFVHGPSPFAFRDIVAIKLHFRGQWIELEPDDRTAQHIGASISR